PEVAAAALEEMRPSCPLYVEQPVDRRDLEGLAEVRRRVPGIPIMADESVAGIEDLRRLVDLGAADLVNLKVMRIGGLGEAIRAHAVAADAGIGVQVGTMIESSVASAAGLHLAAALDGVQLVEMGGPLMLAEDVADAAGWYRGERVTVPERPGLGITPHLPTGT
ncbi:MAG: dipeptide epimerase, partial [Actinobacteria bacterium]|nr:dipeptide epimerase [Actinomycetota bacterium]